MRELQSITLYKGKKYTKNDWIGEAKIRHIIDRDVEVLIILTHPFKSIRIKNLEIKKKGY